VARFVKSGQFISLNDKQSGGLKLPDGATAQRTVLPLPGEIRYNTTSNNLEFFNGNGYQNVAIKGNVTIVKDSFTGDGSTASYILSLTPVNENNILVFVGNVFQNPGVAYSVTGATITFSSPPPGGQAVIVLHNFDSTSV
jgi:hypothetical protein